jgi:hypothetical protein
MAGGGPIPTRAALVEHVHRVATENPDEIGFDNPHLRQRMAQRGLTMRQILETLRRGEGIAGPTIDASGDWRIKLRWVAAGRRVQVVVAIHDNEVSVVTAM